MKQELSALDLYFLEKELKQLENGKIEKIYGWGKEHLIFKIYTKEGKKNLKITPPSLLFLTEKNYEAPTKPPGFCEFLRKYLPNASINKIYQKDFERILIFELTSKLGEFLLLIELFKPGNIILCKKDYMIINSLDRQIFKDRAIKAKQKYEFPPSQANIKSEDTEPILKKSTKTIVKALAIDLGLGGIYAEEILKRTNTKKDNKTDEVNLKKISNEIKNILEEKISPIKVENEIFPIEMLSKNKEETFSTFNEAIDSITPQIKSKEKHELPVSKEEKILKMQKKRLKQLENELQDTQRAGEYIYQHYKSFEILLEKIDSLRKTKSFKEIKKILKENKHFKELNEKEKKIVLEF